MISLSGRSISIIQHNTGTIVFHFFDTDSEELKLDPYIVTFMVKQKKTDSDLDAIITKTLPYEDGNTVIVDLSVEDTANDVGPYWWSIKLTSENYAAESYVNEVMSGPFFILEGVQD